MTRFTIIGSSTKRKSTTVSTGYLCHLDRLTWRVLDLRRPVVVGCHLQLLLIPSLTRSFASVDENGNGALTTAKSFLFRVNPRFLHLCKIPYLPGTCAVNVGEWSPYTVDHHCHHYCAYSHGGKINFNARLDIIKKNNPSCVVTFVITMDSQVSSVFTAYSSL